MNKTHETAVSALLWFIGEQAVTTLDQSGHRRTDVIDTETEVVEARPPALEVFGDGRGLRCGLEEFNPRVADRQKPDLDPLLDNLLNSNEFETEDLVELHPFGKGLDGDSDVIDGWSCHGHALLFAEPGIR